MDASLPNEEDFFFDLFLFLDLLFDLDFRLLFPVFRDFLLRPFFFPRRRFFGLPCVFRADEVLLIKSIISILSMARFLVTLFLFMLARFGILLFGQWESVIISRAHMVFRIFAGAAASAPILPGDADSWSALLMQCAIL